MVSSGESLIYVMNPQPYRVMQPNFRAARVSKLEDIQMKLANIKEQVGLQLHHPYLLKYIKTPVIDEDKLLLLLSMMEHQNLKDEETEYITITTTLIQVALDTHELVSNSGNAAEDYFTKKNRELQVLAGDYYSGLYYKILSQCGNISLIRMLASGIKEINEHKIYFYQMKHTKYLQLMDTIKKIEASIYTNVCDYLDLPIWKELIVHVLFIKRLRQEIEFYNQHGMTSFFKNLTKCMLKSEFNHETNLSEEQQTHLYEICNEYINDSREKIQQILKQMPTLNKLLKDRLLSFNHLISGKTVVREG